MDNSTRHDYLYRVLRPNETPANGLHPVSKHSSSSVSDHVAFGSKMRSQYISTCSDLYTARNFAKLGMEKRNVSQKTIVTIDVSKLRTVSGVKIIDLTDSFIRRHHLENNQRALAFSHQWKEVLVEGHIPAWCIIKEEDVSLSYGDLTVVSSRQPRYETPDQRRQRENLEWNNANERRIRNQQAERERQEREKQQRYASQMAEERERTRRLEQERKYRPYEEQKKKDEPWCTIL